MSGAAAAGVTVPGTDTAALRLHIVMLGPRIRIQPTERKSPEQRPFHCGRLKSKHFEHERQRPELLPV